MVGIEQDDDEIGAILSGLSLCELGALDACFAVREPERLTQKPSRKECPCAPVLSREGEDPMPNPTRALFEYLFGNPAWLKLSHGLLLLGLRWHVAWVFFAAGVLKAQDFSTTLALFDNEYSVPLLAPRLAAWLATGVELLLPPLLAMGLVVRPVAFILCTFNYIASVSYPELSDAGAKDHLLWGVVLLMLALQGGGPLALDRVAAARLQNASPREVSKVSTRSPVSV